MKKNSSRLPFVLPFVLATFIAYPAFVNAAETTQDVVTEEENAQERINFSGKLRMLSQRIPSAACHLARGIDPEGATALLVGATAEFEKILTALEFGGDADLNIQRAETRRKTLARVHELREKWQPFSAAAAAVIDGTATEAELGYVLVENMQVLSAAQLLVEELVKQYSNPNAVPRASLMLVDISGRQRMLTQKMSKETCMIGGDYETPKTASDLEGTMRIFEASLNALRFGMTQVGVNPPPNPQIAAGLEGVLDDWNGAKPYITEILANAELDDAAHMAKFQQLNVTMANMNTVVGMYGAAANPN